ncbi:MAG: hypothetical protein AMJ91_03255 [candidate division Zixibacteria bacterium SM23_73_3]|nr:MAG: hypothetical protein AMJ91_03255 [candidate division Zixibacteria bacterium SM23_73_3]
MRKMKNLAACLVVLGLLFGLIGLALAANTAQQTVTFQVDAIDEVSVSGNPANLVVNTATAGSQPDDDTDNSTSWAVTTNGTNKKMTGDINVDMPANVTLQVNLTAPTGGSSAGDVSLSTTAADLVTTITQVAESGLTITYTLSATIDAGVVAQDTRTVTLTLTDG